MDIYKMADSELKNFATPYLKQLVAACNNKDWDKFSEHFRASGKTPDAKANVENQWGNSPGLCAFKQNFEFMGALRKSDHVATIWKMYNEDTTDDILGVLCFEYENDVVKVHTYRVF